MSEQTEAVTGPRGELAEWLRGIANGCLFQDTRPDDARAAMMAILDGADEVTVGGTRYVVDPDA